MMICSAHHTFLVCSETAQVPVAMEAVIGLDERLKDGGYCLPQSEL